jgi:hypothetical protein
MDGSWTVTETKDGWSVVAAGGPPLKFHSRFSVPVVRRGARICCQDSSGVGKLACCKGFLGVCPVGVSVWCPQQCLKTWLIPNP